MIEAVSPDQRQSTPDYDAAGLSAETMDAASSPATQHREAGKRRRQDTPEYDEGGGSHGGAQSQEEKTPSGANRPGEAAADGGDDSDDGHKGPATQSTSRKRAIPRMSISSFYGPGISGAIAKIRETSLKQSRANVAKEFGKQQLAFDFCDGHASGDENLHVFAREVDGNGRRRFLVTSYGELYRRVCLARQSGGGHYYEVIREGEPCSLYFDIEYATAYNRGKDGGGALSAFCAYLPLALRRLFPLKELNLSPSDIIDLDSSTAKKFSRHLICKINGGYTVFRDNGHMGAFVVRLVAMIEDDVRRGSCKELGLERLYANGSDGRSEIFIDMGVYTKNRCFRTAFSCKHGRRGADLCPSSSNESEYDSGEDEAFFYRSLVTRMPPGIDMDCIEYLFDPSMPAQGTWTRQDSKNTSGCPAGSGLGGCGEQSMWPEVDAYALKTWNSKGGCPGGKIGKVLQADGGGRIVLCLQGNKWCEAVGRHHKSNGVMLIVDTSRGLFYQKCYDPDCRAANSRSLDYTIPSHIIPQEWRSAEEQEEDAAMLKALEDFERNQARGGGMPATAVKTQIECGAQEPDSGAVITQDKISESIPAAPSFGHAALSGDVNCSTGGEGGSCIAQIESVEYEEWDEDVLAAADAAILKWQQAQSAQASQASQTSQ